MAGLVELDDAFVGGRRSGGKCGRGAEGKTPVIVAVESRGRKACFIAMEVTPSVCLTRLKQRAQIYRYRATSHISTLRVVIFCIR